MLTDSLEDLRKSIDNLDNALIYLLSERFRVTDKVGEYKKEYGLPAIDPAREAAQMERIGKLAVASGLDPEVAKKLLRLIIDEVVVRHKEIAGR